MKTITLEQYGAAADGLTNDFPALSKALEVAMQGDCTVKFAENKTYYFEYDSSVNKNAVFALCNCKNVSLVGNNTKILINRPLYYAEICNTQNTVIDGFVFDYKIRPFALGEVIERNDDELWATVKSDRSLYVEDEASSEFAVLQRDDGRYHLFIRKIVAVNPGEFVYKIYFSDAGETKRFIKMSDKYSIILPLPNFAHRIERAFSITDNTDFTIKNCKVLSMARFGFAVLRNYGTLVFDNLRIEKDINESCKIVGWRDCFHVKENHAKCIWNNCYAEYCYDDIFNISASTLCVQNVISDNEIDFRWPETNGIYPCVHKGDTVSVIDMDTGYDYGTAIISDVVLQEDNHNVFRFYTPFKGIKAGAHIIAFVLDNVAPDSIIEGCNFRGTFRFRGPIQIRNTHFYVARFWIDLFSTVEGPVPKNIHFKNCDFVCDDEEKPYFHVVSQKNSLSAKKPYHLENIVFENCKLPEKTFEIDEFDKPFVKFVQ